MTALYGIIGKSLSHSFSPQYFNKKFEVQHIDAEYVKFEIEEITDFPKIVKDNPNLKGLNVTIPYKTAIMPYLDELDERAKAIGAVNCIKVADGKLYGYNTDVVGFKNSLEPLLDAQHKKAIILGDGGAAQAVKFALHELHIPYLSVVRNNSNVNNSITYEILKLKNLADYQIIINTTPLGMHPNINDKPDINYEQLNNNHILYDLIYNPLQTGFLLIGENKGCKIKNGLEMLHLQAEAGWHIWNI